MCLCSGMLDQEEGIAEIALRSSIVILCKVGMDGELPVCSHLESSQVPSKIPLA